MPVSIRTRWGAGLMRLFRRKLARQTGKARQFLHRQDGAVAIEFGMVAAPFLALIFAILETAIVFFADQTLETAVADSSRLIMTGQAQTANMTAASFKTEVCKRIYALFDCTTGVYVDVKSYANFASINITSPIDANGNLVNDFIYSPGGPGSIVVVRLIYKWPVYSVLGFNLANMTGGKRLLVATSAFRNEAYN